MNNASQVIDAATDVKIFIECNKSSNLVVSHEKFNDYEDGMEQLGQAKKKKKEQKQTSIFVLDENYMSNAVNADPEE